MWRRLFYDAQMQWQLVAIVVIPTTVAAVIAASLVRRGATALMRRLLQGTLATSSPFVSHPMRLLWFAAFVLVFSVFVFPAFEAAGLHPRFGLRLRTLSTWTFDSGLRVLLVIAVAFALIRAVGIGVKRLEHDVNFGTGLDALERAKRARTLGTVLTNVSTVIVVLIAMLMILRELHVDITPALTGAGIIGVALGFGSQSLVKDVIGGFFLILENQIRVGDVAMINGIGGLVEAINLRTTILRDEEGVVHVIPNGAINTLANRSLNYSYYVVNLPLAYGEDTDEAAAILKQVVDGMQGEDAYTPFILEPMEILGVDDFEERAVRLKVRIKTAPQKQWFVGREFRRRINKTLPARGIDLWNPQRTLNIQPARTSSPSGPSTPGQS